MQLLSTDSAANSCNFDALETVVFFERCGTTNSFGFGFNAVASMGGASSSYNLDALETAVFFERCRAMVLFDW